MSAFNTKGAVIIGDSAVYYINWGYKWNRASVKKHILAYFDGQKQDKDFLTQLF